MHLGVNMKNSFIDYVSDLLSRFGDIRVKSMFGGYGIYCNNIIFAIMVSDDLYFKADKILGKEFEDIGSYPFTYNARDKTVLMSYYKIPIDIIEDEERLEYWFHKSYKVARR